MAETSPARGSRDLAEVVARFGAALRCAGPAGRAGPVRAVRHRGHRRPAADAPARSTCARSRRSCPAGTRSRSCRPCSTRSSADWPTRRGRARRPGRARPRPRASGHREDLLARAAQAARAHVSDTRPAGTPDAGEGDADQSELEREIENRYLGSTVERLAEQDFAELSDAELLLLAGLMREISLAVPHAPVAPPAPQARRTAHRYAIDLAAGPADRWGCVPAHFTRAVAAAAPPGGAVRHLRVHGAVRAGHDPAAVLRRGRRPGRGVHFATRLTRLTPRWPGSSPAGAGARRPGRARLAGRDQDRGLAEGVQRRLRPPRHGARARSS